MSPATPARTSRASDGVPSAEASASAVAGGRGEPGQPVADELLERLGNRQRLGRVDRVAEHALEREERVAARALVDPEERLAGERPAEAVAEHAVHGADAQRAQRHVTAGTAEPPPRPRTPRNRG